MHEYFTVLSLAKNAEKFQSTFTKKERLISLANNIYEENFTSFI